MFAVLLETFDWNVNDFIYNKGEIVEVVEIKSFKDSYVVYRDETLDFLPKKIVSIIK